MDTLTHGLWGAIALGRSNRRSFWAAFALGMGPDLFSFGLMFTNGLFSHGLDFINGLGHPPDPATIPAYVYSLYNATHSLVVFAAVFGLVWLLHGKPFWELGAWGLHIALDIFTHSTDFFPTPFLWPMSDLNANGVPWSKPLIFFPNVALLVLVYGWFFIKKRRRA